MADQVESSTVVKHYYLYLRNIMKFSSNIKTSSYQKKKNKYQSVIIIYNVEYNVPRENNITISNILNGYYLLERRRKFCRTGLEVKRGAYYRKKKVIRSSLL